MNLAAFSPRFASSSMFLLENLKLLIPLRIHTILDCLFESQLFAFELHGPELLQDLLVPGLVISRFLP